MRPASTSLRAEPEHRDDARKGEEDRNDSEDGAPRVVARARVIGGFGRPRESLGRDGFGAERLHGTDGGDVFAGEGGGFREPVLRLPRAARTARPAATAATR